MTIEFTHEAITKGYSFLAGEVHSFPDEIAELIILTGVAFRVPYNGLSNTAKEALDEAKRRDSGHR